MAKRRGLIVLIGALLIITDGYAQISGACDCWIQPDASYTLINNNSDWNASGFNSSDDGSHGPLALPFAFDLYGTNYLQAWINTNGNITFDGFQTAFSAGGFPAGVAPPAAPDTVMVAPFWADVDLGGGGGPGFNQVYYKVTPTALYVNWLNVGYYPNQTGLVNSFQAIITDGTDPVVPNGGNVSFCYKDMQWTTGEASCDFACPGNNPCSNTLGTFSCDPSSGFGNGYCGCPATVGANKGDAVNYLQFGRFDLPGTAYDGPFGANDGVDWLDFKHLVFTTDATSANVPPIVASQSVCDTLFGLCVGQTVNLDVSFLAPEPGQTTIANSVAPTLGNYTVVSNTTGLVADISTTFTPLVSDTGFHTITFTGTDNGTPSLTTTVTVIAQVLPQPNIINGTLDICGNDPPADLYLSLGGSPVPGGTWTDSIGNAHSGIFDPAIDVSGDYIYTFGAGGNCPSTGIVTVNLFIPPDAGSDTTHTFCETEPLTDLFPLLGGTPVSGGDWTYPNGNQFNGILDPAIDQSGIYNYTVQGTAPCVSASAEINVTIFPVPNAGSNAVLIICANEPPVDLNAVLGGTPDTTGVWVEPGGGPFGGTFNAATDPVGPYTYVVAGAPDCPADSATVSVSVDPIPNAGTDNTLSLCRDAGSASLFNLVAPADAGGTWYDPFGVVQTGTLNPSTDSSGVYYYVVDGQGECSALVDSSLVSAVLSEMPVVSFTADSLASCVPFPVDFFNTTAPGFLDGTCDWSFGDGGSVQICGPTTYTYQNPGVYDVTLTVTTAAGCSVSLTQSALITADPAPTAEFVIDPNPTTVDQATVQMNALSPIPDQWDWNIVGFASFSGSPDIEYTFPQDEGGEYEICLEVEDVYGCTDIECQTLIVIDPLLVYVPNAFTPSGDGINEYFLPVISGDDPDDYELLIFDRWGTLIFESDDRNVPWLGAKDNSGDLLPTGVYVYRLVTRGIGEAEKREYLGHVTLVR
jgi:gliding motility-associated-like protein